MVASSDPQDSWQLLPPSDVEQIFHWNKHLPTPLLACVHNLIEHNAITQPNAPAIHAWDGHPTYAELDVLANRLAHHLVALEAGTEQFIPLCFEKSMWAVVSMLAVLKAGAVCVFLEPTHPMERIQGMLDDMRAKILLCTPNLESRFNVAQSGSVHVLQITENFIYTLPVLHSNHSSLPLVRPGDAAIGLFTSGSTGKPKGIIQDHSTAAFSAQTCSKVFGIGPASRVLQWAAYCFDMSVIDMLMTLVGGGCLCIPSERDKSDNLIKVMRDMSINFAAMTPSFAQTIKAEGVPSLKTLVFGGEPVSKDHLADWPDDVRIINAYGPAESSVCVAGLAARNCPANVGQAVGSVTWIMDEHDCTRLAPLGAVGELLLEGPLLSRGYLNDPQKTAASFLEDPPWLVRARGKSEKPRRLYRTGDLARYGDAGTIILVGRKDTQVKLRGQRIETAEVEHCIRTILPGFTVIVDVVIPVGGSGGQKLAAFIAGETGTASQVGPDERLLSVNNATKTTLTPRLQRLEGQLQKSLPAYMVPSYFIPLQNIPLTTSGKVDRKRLRQIGSSLTNKQILQLTTVPEDEADRAKLTPPATVQEQIAELWRRTLGLDSSEIDPNDDFFKLGGDSISAMKFVAAARMADLNLATKQVFENPTLAAMTLVAGTLCPGHEVQTNLKRELYKEIETDPTSLRTRFSSRHALREEEIEDIVQAPDMQAFMIVCGLLRTRGYINYFAFDLKGDLDTGRLEIACRALVSRHSALRTVFGLRYGRVLQVVLKSYQLEFTRLSSQCTTEKFLARLCETEKTCHARLEDNIVRFMLIKRRQGDHTLIMRISHAQFDGTSLALIYRDLQLAYEGQTLGRVPQYTDFSRAVRNSNTASAEEFWRSLLRGSTMTEVVQHTKPCYANVINDRVSLTFAFAGFYQPSITLATLVKASWAVVLAGMSSTTDVVFGYAVTGRNVALNSIDKIVGDCNNAALARVNIADTATVFDILKLVQEQYLAAIPYESIGLRQMVEKCTNWPRWTRYSTSVNHQNYTGAGLDTFYIGDAQCRVSYQDFEVDRRDVQVYSWPPVDGHMKIEMAFCNHAVPRNIVQNMLEALGNTIQSFAMDVDAPLVIPSSPSCQIPVPPLASKAQSQEGGLPKAHNFCFSLLDPGSIVERVWEKFIESCAGEMLHGVEVTQNLPFYEIAGDLVYAAQFSSFYQEESIDFPMELVIENPTKKDQRGLLEFLYSQ